MLGDKEFSTLIRIFGVNLPAKQNLYPRISGIKVKDFEEQLKLMKDTLPKLLTAEQREQRASPE